MICPWCGSVKMRLSRLQLPDILPLLMFKYPVCCRICHERNYIGFAQALGLHLSRVPAPPSAKPQSPLPHGGRVRQTVNDGSNARIAP
jgi:hypothetical protein